MPEEPFLINPPKKLFRKRISNPLGEALITVGGNPMDGNPWYGDPVGHRIAALMRWGVIPRGPISRYRRRVVRRKRARRRRVPEMMFTGLGLGRRRVRIGRPGVRRGRRFMMDNAWYGDPEGHRKAALKGWRKRRRKGYSDNAWYGESYRHRLAALKGWRRRRRKGYSDNAWYGDPAGHRRAALKGWRRRRRKRYNDNPRRRIRYMARRRYYNNAPEFQEALTGIFQVQNWFPLAITGGLSLTTTALLPNMIAPVMITQPITGPFVKYGIQLVTAFLGAPLVEMVMDRRHSNVWLVTGVGYVGYQLIRDFIVKPFMPQFAVGLGEYEEYYSASEPFQQVGDGSATGYGTSAFPESVSAYPEEVSAYPYDGRYGY